VKEVRQGEIRKWKIRDSTLFLWVDNFTCGHARICVATAHDFIYSLHDAEHVHHTHNIPPIRIDFPKHPTTFPK
jgi:hypothetical protein